MKIEKAIELLELQTLGLPVTDSDDLPGAVKLGLEALRAIKDIRAGTYPNPWRALDGETLS